ncbi:MAG: phytanoyl-CoA dioxygenase family protein [Armatimonadetes bacterium]|nr:phytanoyl-CoA dioxygenase family protein [Armatimonadota bacterium]
MDMMESTETASGTAEKPAYKVAPPGFTPEQWEAFERDGFLLFENALTPDECREYIDVIDEVARTQFNWQPGKTLAPWSGVAHLHPKLTELIDHPRHVGYAYDLYGELLKLHNSQFFLRPPGKSGTKWHNDGARAVPYTVYAPFLPIQLKVAYWLTDLPRPNMGNMMVAPGSHKKQYFEAYTKPMDVEGQMPVCVPAGTMMLMNGNLFHTVLDNDSDVTRYNFFYTYCPSWVCEADRLNCDEAWLKTLTREQRIIMRSYKNPYDRTKPPAEDFPLYLDRETGLDHDPDADLDVPRGVRKRRVGPEKWSK